MNHLKPAIKIQGLQVKSLAIAKKLARGLNIIEEECGIREVSIEMEDVFVCPWIDLSRLNRTPMEKLVRDLFRKLEEK